METDHTTTFVIVCILLLVLYIYTKNADKQVNMNEKYTSTNYSELLDVPLEGEFQPILSPLNSNYVYFADRDTYLLPFDLLDFNNRYDRWMYYYYPDYYSSYYDTYWPFNNQPHYFYNGNYGRYHHYNHGWRNGSRHTYRNIGNRGYHTGSGHIRDGH